MDILKNKKNLREYVQTQRNEGKRISFVPTMGALHEGHLELVRQGLNHADICIPYIFLNPAQFAPTEDLASYPRTLGTDLEKLKGVNASAVYTPDVGDVYPPGFDTAVRVSGISTPLEGEFRPHFFQGVATVVAKMLLQCLPDIAIFGEKDYQQLLVIRQMACDLDIPVEIVGVPTVRDQDGLALSSRNSYLSTEQRKIAIQLNKILQAMRTKGSEAEEWGRAELLGAGFDTVDYCTVRDAQTLLHPQQSNKSLRILAAVWVGKTRLIDNFPV